MRLAGAGHSFFSPAIVLMMTVCLLLTGTVPAAELGRLFTTKQERQMLERLRHEAPEPARLEPVVIPEPEVVEEEVPDVGVIKIKGLVYRKDGNNTAWINEGNTYEGNYTSEYINIRDGEINSNKVPVEIPYNQTRIKLKVGQTYVPADGSVRDVVDISGN